MPESKTSLKQMLYDIRRIEENREILTEKKIQAIYQSLMDNLDAFLAKEYKKYADEDGRLYMTYLDSKRQRAKFLQEIVENVDSITPDLKKTMMNLVNKTYEECYKGMSETVVQATTAENVAGASKNLAVRPEVLKQAVDNNISKLTLPQVMQKHRAEIIYQIQQELNIGLMNGDRYERMAKRISERVGVSMSKANNIVRTESHRNIESGMMDCAERLDSKLKGSDLIYAATWRTMKDNRVRPQVRRRTKHGWRTSYSKNGANHMKMEGVTVRVGELFDLGDGVKAKAPSKSGVAAHDCNCRCYLEYNLMTVEEFAKATGQSVDKIESKYNMVQSATDDSLRERMNDNGITDLKLQDTIRKGKFDEAIQAAKKANRNGACVDTHPMKDLRKYKTFLSKDGMAGVAVKPDGDITAVFKNSNSNAKGAVNDLIITARANGGMKMDCYGQFLVNAYERCGYVPVARVPFNADYVSDPYLLEKKFDVFVMMKNSDDIETVIKKNGAKAYKLSSAEDLAKVKTITDYDEALEYRDKLLSKQK